MVEDRYASFRQLAAAERYGVDFRICVVRRDSPVAVIAPHGGKIEPGTSELACAIAAENHNLYCFEGLRPRPHHDLHITSTRFDEPRGLEIVQRCDVVVALHGIRGKDERVLVGGLHEVFRDQVVANLQDAGIDAGSVVCGRNAGIEPNNICNKGRGRAGIQLEVSRALRDSFLLSNNDETLFRFAAAVRTSITEG